MALLGKGALANWHDLPADGHDDFNAWHTHEHIPERVGVPGFLRGRRYAAVRGAPQYFVLYETEDVGVLRSPAYLDRLNDPTPWTRRVAASFELTIRTAARVAVSFGVGVGGMATVYRLSPADGRDNELQTWLSADALPALVAQHGIVGAHLLQANVETTSVPTQEKDLRGKPDETADWILIIERIGDSGPTVSADDLVGYGASPECAVATYALQTILAADEAGTA